MWKHCSLLYSDRLIFKNGKITVEASSNPIKFTETNTNDKCNKSILNSMHLKTIVNVYNIIALPEYQFKRGKKGKNVRNIQKVRSVVRAEEKARPF